MNEISLEKRFNSFEKGQIKHNTNLENLISEVHTLNTRIDRDFYALKEGALHKITRLCTQVGIHWLLIFAILGILAWKQYTP